MPDESFEYDVFLSHSSQDKEVVRELAERLRSDGVRVWFDEWEIAGGDHIPSKIEEGLERSRILALCMSANALNSDWATLEYQSFRFRDPINKGQRFLPIRLDDAQPRSSLASFHALDWRPEKRETEYPKLLRSCRASRPATRETTTEPDPAPRARPSELLRPGIDSLPGTPLPSQLLTARYQAIGFQKDLAGPVWEQLREWTVEARPVSLRLFTGPGGAGKTRLLQELAAHLRAGGEWDGGFLHELEDPAALDALMQSERPTLVVLDYAESHRHRDALLQGAVKVLPRRTAPLRIVLLARNAGDWWTALQSGAWDGLLDIQPRELPEVKLEGEDRTRFFAHARAELGRILGIESDATPPDLGHERFGRPLYLALAALAQLQKLPTGADTLLLDVLGHETRAWRKQWPEAKLADLRAYMAAVTLRGGVATVEEAEALAARLKVSEEVLDFCELYPGRAFEHRDEYLAPLEPDLLGETLVGQVLKDNRTRANYLPQVFEGAGPEAVESGLIVLGRLELRHQHEEKKVAEWYRRVLSTDLAGRALPAVRAALALGREGLTFTLGRVLASMLEEAGTSDIAGQIGDLIPLESLTLQEAAVWSYLKLLEGDLEPGRRAAMLTSFGCHLQNVGQREAALAATEEAVETYRQLADARPEAFLPDLAMGLNNLGIRLDAVGRREAALAATEEAVEIRRRLAAERPEAFLPALAMSLTNLGVCLDALGRREAALAATEEAVEIRRRLAAERPEAFLPALAMSLNNLGLRLNALGRCSEAVAAAEEAVEIRRRLAAERPDTFLSDLGGSLWARAIVLPSDRAAEAAESATEALAILTGSVRRFPAAFEGWFLGCFRKTVECLQAAGRDPDADPVVAAAREAGRELGFWDDSDVS